MSPCQLNELGKQPRNVLHLSLCLLDGQASTIDGFIHMEAVQVNGVVIPPSILLVKDCIRGLVIGFLHQSSLLLPLLRKLLCFSLPTVLVGLLQGASPLQDSAQTQVLHMKVLMARQPCFIYAQAEEQRRNVPATVRSTDCAFQRAYWLPLSSDHGTRRLLEWSVAGP